MADSSEQAGARTGRIQTFAYHRPPGQTAARSETALCGNERFNGAVHVIQKGEADTLHIQTGVDEFWFVFGGRARFCGPRRTLIGEFSVGDGLLIPAGTRYFVESIGDRDLEMVQVTAPHRGVANERVEMPEAGAEVQAAENYNGRVL